MNCKQCGNEIAPESKFCTKCGAAVETVANMTMEQSIGQPSMTAGTSPMQNRLAGKKNLDSKKMMIIAAAALLVILAIVGIKNKRYKINMQDYVKVEFTGCNGYGDMDVEFDEDKFYEDILKNGNIEVGGKTLKKIIQETKDENMEYAEFIEELGAEWLMTQYGVIDKIDELYDYDTENDENLSNGDSGSVKFTVDNDKAKKYKIKFVGCEKKYKAAGLPEAKIYDPFEHLEVTFTGTSPYVKADIVEPDDDASEYIDYSIDTESGIKKGDTITVTAEVEQKSLMNNLNYYVETTSKEYVCENVPGYVETIEEIPEDMMEKMKSQAEDAFRAGVANSWDNPKSLKEVEFLGNYLLTAKPEYDSVDYANKLSLVYKITVSSEDTGKFSYYYYAEFHNIMLLEDGTCSVDLSDYKVPESGWFSDNEKFEKDGLYYLGYEDLDSLFNHQVTRNLDYYTYVTNIKE